MGFNSALKVLIFSLRYLFGYIIYLLSQLPRISLYIAVNCKISDEQ